MKICMHLQALCFGHRGALLPFDLKAKCLIPVIGPHDPLVGNTPAAPLFVWTFVSVLLLLGGIGVLVWFYVGQYDAWRDDMEPENGGSNARHVG